MLLQAKHLIQLICTEVIGVSCLKAGSWSDKDTLGNVK